MTSHLKWSLGGAGAVGLLLAIALAGMLAFGVGNEEGLFGGTPMELLLWWLLLAVLTTSVSAVLLTLPTLAIRFAAANVAPEQVRALAELALAVPLGFVAAHFLATTYANGVRDSFDWYFLLFSVPGAVLIARVLQRMDKEAQCAS